MDFCPGCQLEVVNHDPRRTEKEGNVWHSSCWVRRPIINAVPLCKVRVTHGRQTGNKPYQQHFRFS